MKIPKNLVAPEEPTTGRRIGCGKQRGRPPKSAANSSVPITLRVIEGVRRSPRLNVMNDVNGGAS